MTSGLLVSGSKQVARQYLKTGDSPRCRAERSASSENTVKSIDSTAPCKDLQGVHQAVASGPHVEKKLDKIVQTRNNNYLKEIPRMIAVYGMLADAQLGTKHPDRRGVERRVCRVSARVHIRGLPVMRGRTVDISPEGVALLLPMAFRAGTPCSIHFSLYVNGVLQDIVAESEVTNCVFLSTNVRVGIRFLIMDEPSRKALATFMR